MKSGAKKEVEQGLAFDRNFNFDINLGKVINSCQMQ
jgi:hypothetical protein